MIDEFDLPPDLVGVPVAMTEVGDVLGKRGVYHYRGRSATELAATADFEVAAAWMLDASSEPLQLDRAVPAEVALVAAEHGLRAALAAFGDVMGFEPLADLGAAERRGQAVRAIGALPTLIASARHRTPVAPDPGRGHVADYLRMVRGEEPSRAQVGALETYFVLTIDHGFSNSAFAARVVASSGTDLVSCLLAALGSLTGPRHGANVERILDMYDEIGEPERAEEWMRAEIAARRRIGGFGHMVYETVDPRLALLRAAGAEIAPDRHAVAMAVEDAGRRVLAGRRLAPNLDLHAPVVLEGCGIPRRWYTATFAAARVVGWCAHVLEQAAEPGIIRPAARYVGPPFDGDLDQESP